MPPPLPQYYAIYLLLDNKINLRSFLKYPIIHQDSMHYSGRGRQNKGQREAQPEGMEAADLHIPHMLCSLCHQQMLGFLPKQHPTASSCQANESTAQATLSIRQVSV